MSDVILKPSDNILESWALLSVAFGTECPMLDEMYPARSTPEGDRQAAVRLERKLKKDNGIHCINAYIDGQLAGAAVWQFMDKLPATTIQEWESDWEATWPEGDERDYLSQMWKGFIQPRYNSVVEAKKEGKRVLLLEYLAVSPDFRRRGVGEALVAWGVGQADQEGINTVLEGTTDGGKLYRRVAFEDIKQIDFPGVDAKFAQRKKPELMFMRRLPQQTA